jgi:hypothetical protein
MSQPARAPKTVKLPPIRDRFSDTQGIFTRPEDRAHLREKLKKTKFKKS